MLRSSLVKPSPLESSWRIAPSPSSIVNDAPTLFEFSLQSLGNRGLPGSRQSGKPDAKAIRVVPLALVNRIYSRSLFNSLENI